MPKKDDGDLIFSYTKRSNEGDRISADPAATSPGAGAGLRQSYFSTRTAALGMNMGALDGIRAFRTVTS